MKSIFRCGLCDVDLSNMTEKEQSAHFQSKEHVERWMDHRLDAVIKKGKKKERSK